MKRIIAAQGSMPLLNVLTTLEYQKRIGEISESEDYLLIGGLYTSDKRAARLTASICEQMARIWPFKKIYFLENLENAFESGLVNFDQAVHLLRRKVAMNQADVIYVGRNWQPFNELVLAAFEGKHVVANGDALGFLDVDLPQFGRVHNPKGLCPVDAAYLINPVEGAEGFFEKHDIHIVDPYDFARTVAKVAPKIDGLSEFFKSLNLTIDEPCQLLITAYDTDAALSRSLEKEIQSYCDLVKSEMPPSSKVFVKGHPRESSNQSAILVGRLKALGFEAVSLAKFNQVPVEIFTYFLNLERVLAGNSFASISLAYLCQSKISLSFGEQAMRKTVRPEWHNELLEGERVRILSIAQAFKEKFEPIFFAQWKHTSIKAFKQPTELVSVRVEALPPIQRARAELQATFRESWKIPAIVSIPSNFSFHWRMFWLPYIKMVRRIRNLCCRLVPRPRA